MEGRRAEGGVVFAGEVDLGAEGGGIYKWTGRADGQRFTGQYTSRLYNGTFSMDKVRE
jgi:hypothetical protein